MRRSRSSDERAAMAKETTDLAAQARLVQDTRRELLNRLHRRSDDFAATEALRALDTYSAPHHDPHGPKSDSERLVHAGLSANARMRAWRPWRSPPRT